MDTEQAAEHEPDQTLDDSADDGRGEGGRWRKGHCPNPNGRRGKGPKITTGSTDGLPLDDRMVLILAEEWSDAELRRMARKDPATYQKLLALASKVRDKGAGAPSAVAPPPPDEPTERVVALAEQLLRDLAAKHGGRS